MAKTFGDRIAELIGLVPASKIAGMFEDDSLEKRINRTRGIGIAAKIGEEITNTFSTFALLNVLKNPIAYLESIMLGFALDYTSFKAESDLNLCLETNIISKLYELLQYSNEIEVALADRGYLEGDYFRVYDLINQTEDAKFGLTEAAILSRPLAQAFAARNEIPFYIIGLTVLLAYASLPFSLKVGEQDQITSDIIDLIPHAISIAERYGFSGLENRLHEVERIYWAKRTNNHLKKMSLDKLMGLGFLALSLTIKKGKFAGMNKYLNDLFSTHTDFRDITMDQFENKRALGFVNSFYEIISGNPYMLTNKSWDDYRHNKIKTLTRQKEREGPGISVVSLKTLIPGKQKGRYAPELSFEAKPGDVIYLQVDSGKGKSVTTGLGFTGALPSEGTIYFKDNKGGSKALEEFTRAELKNRIVYIASTYCFEEMRVVDVYQNRIVDDYLKEHGKTKKELNDYETLMLTLPDAMLEREMYALAIKLKKSGHSGQLRDYDLNNSSKVSLEGIIPSFPTKMFSDIYLFRQFRNDLVENLLVEKKTNLSSVTADAPIGNMSTGMKTRFMWELWSEIFGINRNEDYARILVLDEPFSSLDKKTTKEYLGKIKKMRDSENPPVTILISHAHEELIEKVLGVKKFIKIKYN
jgi:ABC-type dipeptide/oligopeptide/nickel transport system ATPase subunit